MNKQELASKIWSMADKMRSKIKANEYKDYILGFIFYKFLSDKETTFLYERGFTDEEIKDMDENVIEFLKDNIGYAISYNNLFSTWKNMSNELNVKVVATALDEFNKNIHDGQKKVFENIFNTLQNGLDKLGDSSGSKDRAVRDIVGMIDEIPTNKEAGYDVLGYIYEYLIYKFATAAKDDGAFYTPHEVSTLMADIVAEAICGDGNKTTDNKINVYDPTSGSGSLLLNIGQAISKRKKDAIVKYFGQEKITETYHLTRMNLIMKGIAPQNVFVRNGDTLENDWPYFDDTTTYERLRVNAVVSNPPYSLRWDPENHTMDDRYKKYGLAPSGKADYAFLLHCLYHMEDDGIMAIVLPHGVLFRGDSEYEIRKNLCMEHNIETIIGLPSNLFYATGIPTIVMVLRKNRSSDDILFIDASQNFEKGKNQNVLRDCDIKRIFDAVKERKDVDGFAKLVTYNEISEKNDFNLNITRYVSASKESETYDFAALMNETAPNAELDKHKDVWNEFPSLRSELFTDLGNGYSSFNSVDVKSTIENNADVLSFTDTFNVRISEFKQFLVDKLVKTDYPIDMDNVKEAIIDKVFDMVKDIAIVDKYDVYQLFMNNWPSIETDMCNIGSDKAVCRSVEPNMVLKAVKNEKVEIQNGWKGIVIPFDIVGQTFFKEEYSGLQSLKSEIETLTAENADMYENLDDDMKQNVGDGEKFKDTSIKKYIKDNPDVENIEDLNTVLDNITKIKEKTKSIKDVEAEILEKIKDKYENLTDDEIDELLVEKWICPLCDAISGITKQVVNTFASDIDNIKKKYEKSIRSINAEIEETNAEFISLLSELTGSETDMAAIEELKAIL